MQGLDQAQQFLTEGLQVAQVKCDRAVKLEQKRRHLSKARRWATEAWADFKRLGMIPEAQETQALIQATER